MNTFKTIKKRRSIRSYKDVDIDKNKIEKLIRAAIWAPSASNKQKWRIIAIKKDLVKKIDRFSPGLYGKPPVILILCLEQEKKSNKESNTREESLMNMAIAAQNITLQATAMDLGSCIVKSFNKKATKKILDLENMEPELMISIGIPNEQPNPPSRRDLDDVVKWEGW